MSKNQKTCICGNTNFIKIQKGQYFNATKPLEGYKYKDTDFYNCSECGKGYMENKTLIKQD